MIRWLLLILIITPVYAEEAKPILIKKGEAQTIPAGWMCYDPKALDKFDEAQKSGIKCLKELKEANNVIEKLNRDQEIIDIIEESNYRPPIYKKPWFKMGVGVVIGVAFGFGIGASL